MKSRPFVWKSIAGLNFFAVMMVSINVVHGENLDLDQLTDLAFEDLLQVDVQSASNFTQKLIDAPASVTIITAEEIQKQGYRTIGEALGTIRGMYIQDDRNYQYLGARGFSPPSDYNTRVLLLVDGMRYNDVIYDAAYLGNEGPVGMSDIERIEYVPGPGSALYGNNAFFGVVNIITKSGSEINGAELEAGYGSFNTRKARFTHGKRVNRDLEYIVSFSAMNADGEDLYYSVFDDPATNYGMAENRDGESKYQLLAKAKYKNTEFSMSHSTRTKEIPTASYAQAFNEGDAFTTDITSQIGVQHRADLDNDLKAVSLFQINRFQYDGDYIFDYPPLTINRDAAEAIWSIINVRIVSTQINNNTLVAGVEYRKDIKNEQTNGDVDPEWTYLDTNNLGERVGAYINNDYKMNSLMRFNAGLRYDYSSEDSYKINPRLAVIASPNERSSIKAIYGTAYRAPNGYEKYYGDAGGYVRNPNLEAEDITIYELVYENYLTDQLRLSGSFYQHDINDLINLTMNGNGDLTFDNVDSARSRGLEAEIEYHWVSGATLRVNGALTEAEDGATGELLANSPRAISNIVFSAPIFTPRLYFNTHANFVSGRKTLKGGTTGRTVDLNATVTYRIPKHDMQVFLGVFNMLDRENNMSGSVEHEQDVIAQPSRFIEGRLTYKF